MTVMSWHWCSDTSIGSDSMPITYIGHTSYKISGYQVIASSLIWYQQLQYDTNTGAMVSSMMPKSCQSST